MIEDYSKQNTRYLEIRSTPKARGDIQSKEQYIITILEAIQEMERSHRGIKVAYLVSVNRNSQVEELTEAIELLEAFRERASTQETTTYQPQRVVGLDISGDPRSGDFSKFLDELNRAKELGFKITLHCAETDQQSAEAQQMIDFRPDRLGHCTFLSKNQMQQVADLGIPVEICPTSGTILAQCGLVNFLPPLLEFAKLQHNVIIGCDDTLVFNTTHSMELFEYAKAVKAFGTEALK